MGKHKTIDLDDFEQVGIHPNSVFKFFHSLYLTNKPKEGVPDSVHFNWAIRYYSGFFYFTLGDLYHRFISWITQYYPFSLLYPDSLINAKNKLLKNFVIQLEKLAKASGISLLICGNSYDGTLFIFEALLYEEPSLKAISKFELLLQKKLGSVYIRKDSLNKVRVIMPHESLHKGLNMSG